MLRLKEVLKEKGVTGKDLAEKVEVTPASISNIVNGAHFPKPELLKKIANELDVDVRDLFYSTKDSQSETLYIKRGDSYIPIGEINVSEMKILLDKMQ